MPLGILWVLWIRWVFPCRAQENIAATSECVDTGKTHRIHSTHSIARCGGSLLDKGDPSGRHSDQHAPARAPQE
jgi:hypothetical protein